MKTYALLNATGLISPGTLSSLRLVDSAGGVKKVSIQNSSPNQTFQILSEDSSHWKWESKQRTYLLCRTFHFTWLSLLLSGSRSHPRWLPLRSRVQERYNQRCSRFNFPSSPWQPISNAYLLIEKPKIDLDEDYPGYFDSAVDLVCNVYSLLPFDIKWSRYVDGQWISLTASKHFRWVLINFKDHSYLWSYSESASDVYHIDEVVEESEGIYRCLANNSVGFNYGDTFLDVEGESSRTIDLV